MKLFKALSDVAEELSDSLLEGTVCMIKTVGFFIFFTGDSDRSKKELNEALRGRRFHKAAIFSLIVLFVGLSFSASVGPWVYQSIFETPTTFNVSAVTEEVKVITANMPMSQWPVKDVDSIEDCSAEKNVKYTFPKTSIRYINVNPFVEVTFTRISNGKLIVTMYHDDGKSVGDLFDINNEYLDSLSGCAFFHINDIVESAKKGGSVVFPITGKISPGKKVRFLARGETPVLREGKITMLARSFVINENYSVDPFNLVMGDTFDIQDLKDPVPSQGLLLVNEKPAINLIYRAEGLRGTVKRYQSEDYVLKNSFWSRLYNDTNFALAWVIIIILFNFIRVYLRFLVND